ncbi:MAG: phosphoglycerate kinase [Candidatus Vogelbacteria bacterium]|nr:phosphoglycerate kinase [Candidatus Vogelbacteria bacterium]
MKTITQLKRKDLSNKKVLVRVDFNVPIKKGQVADGFRIEQSLPTINYLLEKGARVILVSHLGSDGKASLAPIAKYLNKIFPTKLIARRGLAEIDKVLNAGQVVLLENIRRDEGEKKNDPAFAKQLAGLADVYVNDAFSVSHRAHASVSAITKYLPSYAGLLFIKEFKNLSLALKPKGKMVAILGGLKFQTKIPLIKKFLKTADQIFIGGALANTFMKAMGCDIGASIADKEVSYLKPLLKNKKIILPLDLVINKKNQIVDIGEESLGQIREMVKGAKLILWNGPMGWFEVGEKSGTLEVANIVAEAKGFSVVGGGDTLSAIEELKLMNKFGFVSTAGGAMLDFLATGTLPGIKALK